MPLKQARGVSACVRVGAGLRAQDVRVVGTEPHGKEPWEQLDYYVCEGVQNGIARGNTYPVPKCFKDETTATLAKKAL